MPESPRDHDAEEKVAEEAAAAPDLTAEADVDLVVHSDAGEANQKAKEQEKRGKELHREFVGMLFALAIAEVAVQASAVVNSGLDALHGLPAYLHLVLAATVIATSWVGWGWSKAV